MHGLTSQWLVGATNGPRTGTIGKVGTGLEIGVGVEQGTRWVWAAAAALVCFGCGFSPSRTSQPEDLAAVASEVEAALWAFHAADTARDAEGVIGLLWPEFTMLADGSRATYDDVVTASRDFMAGLAVFYTEWDDVEVTPLGENVAITSFQFSDSIVTKTGEITRARGPTTFVWQRRDGVWRVLYADADHYPIER